MSGSHTPNYKIIRKSIYSVVNKDEEIYNKVEMDTQQSYVFNMQLIELVKQNPLLYDHAHPGHKNKIAKEAAWVKISEQLNFDVESVKKRYRNLRDRFVRERRLGTKGWKLYKQLEFFAEFLPEPRRYSIKQELKRHNQSTNSDGDLSDPLFVFTHDDSSQVLSLTSDSLQEQHIPEPWNARKLFITTVNEENNSDTENYKPNIKHRKHSIEYEQARKTFETVIKGGNQSDIENYTEDFKNHEIEEYEEEHLESTDSNENIKQIYKDDEDILFLLSLAPALKRMSRSNRNKVKIRMLEIISEHDV